MKQTLFLCTLVSILALSCKDEPTPTPTKEYSTGMLNNSGSAMSKVDEADIDEDPSGLPTKFLLSGPPIINQGKTSKCVAFSAGYFITSMYNGVTSTDLNVSGTPDYLYGKYKKVNGDNNCSEGCMLFDDPDNKIIGAATILRDYGTTSWNQLPFENVNACAVLNSTLDGQAAANKIKNYYRLDAKEFTDVKELKSWLYAGFPLWFGVNIDDGFQNLEAGDVWSKASGKDHGGHAMVIDGYDEAKKAFRIANSWGDDWADGGHSWVDFDYFVSLLKSDDSPEIGILVPNDKQRVNMSKVSPAACANGNWGDINIDNQLNQEIAIEFTGANNYNNNEMGNVDAAENQFFTRIPSGTINVKVLSADKSSTIKTLTATVNQCKETVLIIN